MLLGYQPVPEMAEATFCKNGVSYILYMYMYISKFPVNKTNLHHEFHKHVRTFFFSGFHCEAFLEYVSYTIVLKGWINNWSREISSNACMPPRGVGLADIIKHSRDPSQQRTLATLGGLEALSQWLYNYRVYVISGWGGVAIYP